jgi:hypothetical protein
MEGKIMSTKRTRREVVSLAAASGVAGMLLGASPARAATPAATFQHFRSNELHSKTMKVTNPKLDKPGRSYHILHKVETPELRVGDVLIVCAECEITSELDFAIAIASFVAVAKSTDTAETPVTSLRYICFPAGSNIINNVHHHLFFTRTGSIQITEKLAGLNAVNFMGYAASDARKAGDKVQVMDRYGHLSVTLLRSSEA